MPGLAGDLAALFAPGRSCAVVGIGNDRLSDDGFGPRFADRLAALGWDGVIAAGTTPEKETFRLEGRGYTDVLLVDAVRSGSAPGTAVFMDAERVTSLFPQVSTHKMSLGLLASYLKERFGCSVWLLGVEPLETGEGKSLSPAVERTLDLLIDRLRELRPAGTGPVSPECRCGCGR
jgi:hydrogenase maturation protease